MGGGSGGGFAEVAAFVARAGRCCGDSGVGGIAFVARVALCVPGAGAHGAVGGGFFGEMDAGA